MKTPHIFMIAALALAWPGGVSAQDPQTNAAPEKPKEASVPAASDPSKPSSDDAETKFKTLLKKATLSGRWCMVKDGQLGPDKEDKYTIVAVQKMSGDSWLVNARVKYGEMDFVAPIPVTVKWAGDTPVIVVDKLTIPGGGTYSARVMFFEKTYSGTWTAGDHGGLLHGVITNEKE